MSTFIFISVSKYTKYYEATENVGQSFFLNKVKIKTYNLVFKKNRTLI